MASPVPRDAAGGPAHPWDHWRGKAARVQIPASAAVSPEAKAAPFAAFRAWMATRVASGSTPDAASATEGVALAKARREAMARWIREDPAFALEMAVSRDARANLPAAVLEELEMPFSRRGDLEVLIVCGSGISKQDQFRRSVTMDGVSQKVFVYGRRANQATKYNIPLHGIALDGLVALHESPVRQLDPLEGAAMGFDANVIPLHVGDGVMAAVGDRDAQSIEANLIAAENVLGPHVRLMGQRAPGGGGGGSFPPGTMAFPPTPSHTFGAKRFLVIRIDFSDDTTVPVTLQGVNAVMTNVNRFFIENSRNQTSITVSNIPVVLRMPQTKAFYAGASVNVLRADALAAARTFDAQNGGTGAFNPDRYDLDTVAFSNINGAAYGFAGLATLGGKGMWVNGAFDLRVLAHELGHNYGLSHANRWDVTGTDPIDPNGTHNEYGDNYDMMGANNFDEFLHFNEWFKSYLLWIPAGTGWRSASTGGVYRIFRHDSTLVSGVRAVTIGQQSDRAYWLGFRRADPTDTFLSNGLEVRWGMQPPGLSSDMTQGSRLLNMTPAVANFSQHALPLGRTFGDTNIGFFITPTTISGTFSNEFIDVNISYTIPPPTITTNPVSQTVLVGGSATFSVAASGAGPFTFQWFFNGTFLPGATSSNLTLSNITTNQAGNYTVSVANAAGSVVSSPAVLTVLVLPAITAQPQSQTVGFGSNATFTVTATGTAPLRYQWDFNGSIIPNATNATLVLTNVQLAQAGNYSVAVTNLAGATNSAVAVLNVTGGTGPPVIVQQPSSLILPPGQTANFFVGATGLIPLTYQWFQNGVAIPNATNSALSRVNISPADAGIYSVFVANTLGTATSSNAFLTVGAPPTLFITPSNVLASLGENVTFTFTPPNGTIDIQWFRGPAPAPLPGPSPIAGATNSTLTLTSVTVTNSGPYSVQTRGSYGHAASTPGGDAVLTVVPFVLTGSPSPVAHWRFDEAGGPVALDSAGNNHGLLSATGAAFVTNGIRGNALSLNRAAGGFVNAGRVLDFTNTPFTIVAWLKLTTNDTQNVVVVGKRTPGGADGYELGANVSQVPASPAPITIGQTNRARFHAGAPTTTPISTTAVTDGSWHQLVASYFPPVVPGLPGLKLYVDGAPVEGAATNVTIAGSAADFLLGGISTVTGPASALDGLLDDVQVYNRTLSDSEIDFLFQNPGQQAQNATNATVQAPLIMMQPQGLTVSVGTPASFVVSAVGAAPLSYQWLFNGLPIPGAKASNLVLAAARPSDAGPYRVAVFSTGGMALSADAPLVVIEPPVIISPPQSQTVAAGSTVTFDVAAGGTGPLNYIWRKGGLNLNAPSLRTLTLPNVQPADAASYDVVVFNAAGAMLSPAATLSILGAPAINVQPASQSVLPGATVTFTVGATGTAPLAYQWRKNGVNIPGANGSSFQIPGVSASDAAAYSVVVSNGGGAVTSQNALLGLVGAPLITAHPASINLPAGQNASFSVTATGTAPLAYQWLFEDSPLPGATNAALVVSNASVASEGSYRVVVTNSIGSASSSAAELTVTIAPVILQQPQSLSVPAGATAVFSVVALGTAPPLTYQWRLNGTNLANATGPSVTIPSVSPASLGFYSVVVTDGRGTVASGPAQLSLGNANPEVILFDGSTVTNFHPRGFPSLPVQWQIVPTNALEVAPATGDLDSFALFNDFQLHVEFRTESPPNIFQSDVGIHLQGRYEVQIRESFGQTTLDSTNCGGIFGVRAPDVNASLPPGQWQSFDITFRSARWNGNTKIANARVTVIHNGVLVQNDVEIPDRTFNADFETPTPGPIRLMGGIPRVQYRNVRVTPLDVPPVFQFATAAGSVGDDFVRGLARDPSGNLYIAGAFSGSVTLGNVTFNTAGGRDIIVAKLDAAGNVIWARQAGGAGDDFGHGVAVDNAGNVFLGGSIQFTAQFGTTTVTSTGQSDGFLAKYDAGGNLHWVRRVGGAGNDAVYAVGTDDAGNATIAGDFSGTANFGALVLVSAGGLDGFVARFDAAGNPMWAVRHGGAGDNNNPGLRVDPTGVAYVAGSFPNTATFGVTTLTSRGSNDAFVAKLDNTGAFQWARQFGGPGDDQGNDVAFGPGGAVHLAGRFQGTVTNGTNVLTTTGGNEIFLTKLDAAGSVLWTRQAGGISNDVAFGVAADGAGNVFVTGTIGGPATFSSTPVANAGLDDLFITKFDAAGVIQWVKTAGGTLANSGHRVETDAAGNAYVAGDFSGAWSLDSFPLTAGGGSDFFITKVGNAIANTVPPAIVLQPQGRAVAPGSPVTFAVSATGTQPLAYQWKRNGVDIAGATVSTYFIPVVQPGDAGSYSVIVSNAAGAALSAPAVLTIIGPPFITLQPVPSQLVNPGETITLTVAATGSDPLTFIWRRNGTNLNAPSLPSLVLNNIQPADAGTYDVTIFNTAGALVSATATISVRPNPVVTASPAPQTVALGGTAVFSVSAAGTGALNFQWRRNAQPVAGATSATLTLNNVQVADSGTYDVVVTDTIGAATSAGAQLAVLIPPAVVVNPLAQFAVAGTNVQFAAQFSGNPAPGYQWFRNSAPVAGATNVTLLLTNVTTNLAGIYTIAATNLAGGATSAPVQLAVVTSMVLPPPPTPNAQLKTNGFAFNVALEPGRIYRVQASTNFVTWTDIGFVVGSGGFVQSFIDRAASNRPNRFYRVVTP